jgi:hypothetical protein
LYYLYEEKGVLSKKVLELIAEELVRLGKMPNFLHWQEMIDSFFSEGGGEGTVVDNFTYPQWVQQCQKQKVVKDPAFTVIVSVFGAILDVKQKVRDVIFEVRSPSSSSSDSASASSSRSHPPFCFLSRLLVQ